MDSDGIAFDFGVLDGCNWDFHGLVVGNDRDGWSFLQSVTGQLFQAVEADLHLLGGGGLDQIMQGLHLIAEEGPFLHAGDEDDGKVGAPDADSLGEADAIGLAFACVDIHEQQIRFVGFYGLKQVVRMVEYRDVHGCLPVLGNGFDGFAQLLRIRSSILIDEYFRSHSHQISGKDQRINECRVTFITTFLTFA